MNRLTMLTSKKVGEKYEAAVIWSGPDTWDRITRKLADYENTGMEPDEVADLIHNFTELGVSFDKLRELVENCGEGKYIPVEALVGETVWIVEHYTTITPYEITHIDVFGEGNTTYYCQGQTGYHAFDEEQFGDNVFHTAEQAKAALDAVTVARST